MSMDTETGRYKTPLFDCPDNDDGPTVEIGGKERRLLPLRIALLGIWVVVVVGGVSLIVSIFRAI